MTVTNTYIHFEFSSSLSLLQFELHYKKSIHSHKGTSKAWVICKLMSASVVCNPAIPAVSLKKSLRLKVDPKKVVLILTWSQIPKSGFLAMRLIKS